MRIDWHGSDAMTEEGRLHAETWIRKLGANCGQMTAFEVSMRGQADPGLAEFRATCRCSERSRCLVAVRRGLAETLHAFESIADWRCGGPA
jgi:hypothetical protein